MRRQELLNLVLDLVCVDDAHILNEANVLNSVCLPADIPLLQELARMLISLRDQFDYRRSLAFNRLVDGKTEEYRRMADRLERQPVRRRDRLAEFDTALAGILQSRDVYDLLPESYHGDLDQVVAVLGQIHDDGSLYVS